VEGGEKYRDGGGSAWAFLKCVEKRKKKGDEFGSAFTREGTGVQCPGFVGFARTERGKKRPNSLGVTPAPGGGKRDSLLPPIVSLNPADVMERKNSLPLLVYAPEKKGRGRGLRKSGGTMSVFRPLSKKKGKKKGETVAGPRSELIRLSEG